ncbi:MAG TPA: cation diffusion facilitator family transporter [Pirellulales bacterium]
MTAHHSHSHAAGHHGHDHRAARDGVSGRLAWSLVLVLVYMVVELAGGWMSNSLALLADAGHMFSDAGALALSLFAAWITRRPANSQRTYGYYRAEILAALANGAALGAISIGIVWEAYHRLWNTPEVRGPLMMAVAVGGLLVNAVGLWLLHPGGSNNINLRGAWLHVASDLLGSLAALFSGALVWTYGWNWADPLASALISVLIVYSSWGLLSEAISILMESTPRRLDLERVSAAITAVDGVLAVHDLHAWTITSGMDALSGHVTAVQDFPPYALLAEVRRVLHEQFGLDHVTIQVEPLDFDGCPPHCPSSPPTPV